MITLMAEARETLGKELAADRAAGRLPVVIYGGKEAARSLFVDTKEFKKVLAKAGESTLVTVMIGDEKKDVLIHEVAHNPISGEVVHADLLVVDTKKPIKVHVPFIFEGVAPAVKELGGALVKVMHEIEVEALPKDLPHDIVIDVSVLNTLDAQIHVSDLKLPHGVTTEADPEEVIASITEAGEEVVVEEGPADLSAIEVEKKGKTEEEGTEEAK
ncbi:MAG: 50S ribosomal protein L25 [Candidatus Paceibacterota bacterium]|jgi:large subunit ribosomal protein L25